MDKQNVVYTNNGILFSLKRKGNSAYATTWVNFNDTMLTEINQLQKKTNTVWAKQVGRPKPDWTMSKVSFDCTEQRTGVTAGSGEPPLCPHSACLAYFPLPLFPPLPAPTVSSCLCLGTPLHQGLPKEVSLGPGRGWRGHSPIIPGSSQGSPSAKA